MADKKVLIIDYDTQSLDALTRLVRSQRIQVITASDGQAGYEKFRAEKPDLVILEAILPKVHGFDLTKKIATESGGQTPVIVVTGLYKGPQYRHEAIVTYGAADYFEKPVDPDRFTDAVGQLVRDEEDIEEPLPAPEAVLENLAQRTRDKASREKG